MKKMLFWAAVSAIALTSCVNEENFEGPKPQAQVMRFDAPVMKQTRANVKGEITGVKYDVRENFMIFSKIYKGAFTGWATSTGIKDFFSATGDVATNEGTEGKESQYWSTATTYYWPDHEYNLAFAAYSPAEMIPAPASIKMTEKGLQIADFKTAAEADEQYDLMYTDRVIDRNKSNNGSSAVPLVFHHALSSIVFSTEKEDENVDYVITEATLSGKFVQEADFNQNIVEADSLTAGTALWENKETATAATYAPEFSDFHVTTTPTQFTMGTSALLLIPQTVPEDAIVTIKYTKTTNKGTANADTTENTINVNLSLFAQENGNKITTWEMGKRYVYRLAFGQNKKIYFEPKTEDWIQEPTLIYVVQ